MGKEFKQFKGYMFTREVSQLEKKWGKEFIKIKKGLFMKENFSMEISMVREKYEE